MDLLINKMKSIIIKPQYIDFIIGFTTDLKPGFENTKDTLIILINNIMPTGSSNTKLNKIEKMTNFNNKKIFFYIDFPLSHNFPNSLEVINKLFELNDIVKIRITNKICGTCFRSFYYMVREKNIKYSIKPEQGSNVDSDTKSCFEYLNPNHNIYKTNKSAYQQTLQFTKKEGNFTYNLKNFFGHLFD